jgi:hypothetical protein
MPLMCAWLAWIDQKIFLTVVFTPGHSDLVLISKGQQSKSKVTKVCTAKCCKSNKSIQSRKVDIWMTFRCFSYGRCSGLSKKASRHSRYAVGVHISGVLWIQLRRRLNKASMSSWECPLDKKESCAAPSFPNATCAPKWRRSVWFLHSFTQLSACKCRQAYLKSRGLSRLRVSSVRACETTSTVLEELHVNDPWASTVSIMCPCIRNPVHDIFGRMNLLNNLVLMTRLLGHEYFTASIESKIPQSWKVPSGPKFWVACCRLRARHS